MQKLAQRMGQVAPFYVMKLLARAAELQQQGRQVVHMEVGEPDFDTPLPVVDAGVSALQQGRHHYTQAAGIPPLRQAISDFYRDRYQVEIPVERIIVTPGSSGALQLAMATLLNPGDGIMMADPSYPCNRNLAMLVGAEVNLVPVDEETRYQLTLELVRAHWRENTRIVMLANPSNPTGTLVDEGEMQAIADWAAEKGAALLVDEIYQGLTYESRERSVLRFTQDAVVVNSFSKYFGMTGWRLGWMVVPQWLAEPVDRLAQNLFLCPPAHSQYAALAAFSETNLAILEQRRAEFKRRRDYLLPELRRMGMRIPVTPDGAFYLYADASAITSDSYQFAWELLEKEAVAITPGRDFGNHRQQQHLRFAYTTSIEQLREGVSRLERFIRSGNRRA